MKKVPFVMVFIASLALMGYFIIKQFYIPAGIFFILVLRQAKLLHKILLRKEKVLENNKAL
jgi:hypothetical protein